MLNKWIASQNAVLRGDENFIELRDRSHLCYKSIINYDLDIANFLVISPQIRYIEVFDLMNPRFNEQIWSVPSDFVKSRFHCMDPWWTPWVTVLSFELPPLHWTNWFLLARKLRNHACSAPEIPFALSFWSNNEWSMTSKAFRKSKNMAVVISPLSFAHFHSLTTSSNEAIVEGFLGICKLFFSHKAIFSGIWFLAVHLQTAHGFLTLQEERKLACSFLCQISPRPWKLVRFLQFLACLETPQIGKRGSSKV